MEQGLGRLQDLNECALSLANSFIILASCCVLLLQRCIQLIESVLERPHLLFNLALLLLFYIDFTLNFVTGSLDSLDALN
jgi:hypothetical protein